MPDTPDRPPPPGAYVIQFEEWARLQNQVHVWAAMFYVTTPSGEVRIAQVAYSALAALEALNRAGYDGATLEDVSTADNDYTKIVRRALLRLAVRRLEEAIEHGAVPSDGLWAFTVSEEEVETLVRLLHDKHCRYQIENAGDLYCSAASTNDETRVGSVDLRVIAPTSRPLCDGCAMPNSEVLCSHLSHPGVFGLQTGGGTVRRDFYEAFCERGRPEITTPAGCRAGGHECWQRVIAASRHAEVVQVAPAALAEAVDHVHTVWRLTHGRQRRLFALHSAAEVTGLALPCATRDEFESRMSDLADLLSSIVVEDDMIPGEAPEGALNRFQAALDATLQEEDIEQVHAAIAELRKMVAVRVALQHSGAQPTLRASLEALGLVYPLDEYASAWNAIRSRMIDAFVRIRRAVERAANH